MKIAILSDRSTLHHPFGRLLVQSLTQDGHQVVLASTDSVNERMFYDFRKSERILSGYSERRRKKYNFVNSWVQKRLRFLSPWLLKGISLIRKIDKRITRFRARQIVSSQAYLMGAMRVFQLNVDVVIVSRPQTVLAQIVLVVIRKTKLRGLQIIYYPYELYGQQYNKYNELILRLEKLFVRKFYDAIVVPSSGRLDYYKSINPNIRGCVVRNFKRFIPTEKVDLKRSDGYNLVYLGLLDYGRRIEEIIARLELLPPRVKFTLLGRVRKQWLSDNQDNIKHWSTLGKLELVEEVPESQVPRQLSMHDIGLISYDETCLNNILCAPAKVTDYLHADLPIIAPNLQGMREISQLNSNIELYDSSDLSSLFAALTRVLLKLDARPAGSISETSSILNWDNEFKKFQTLLASLVN